MKKSLFPLRPGALKKEDRIILRIANNLFLGLETTADKLLTSLKKKHTSLSRIRWAVQMCQSRGINAGASLIIGFPSQTLEDILTDITTLIRLRIPIYAINPLYPLPGTGMYDECVKLGILTGKEDYIFLGSDNYIIHNDSFSREDIYWLWVGVKAYTRWGYIRGEYTAFDTLGAEEALDLIARAYDGKAEKRRLTVRSRAVNAVLISGHYQLFCDMTRSFLYLLTGEWCECAVDEGDTVTVDYIRAGIGAPGSLGGLKKKMSENPAPDGSV